MTIKRINVYDMDGTIVCSQHRYKLKENNKIDLEHWRKNSTEEKIFQDKLLPLAEQYKKDLQNPEVYVIIATARACEPNDATYKFIAQGLGMPDKFIHRRGNKDNRKGAYLKITSIRPLLNLRQFKNAVVHIFEDNIDYMNELCLALNGIGHYIKSEQGY